MFKKPNENKQYHNQHNIEYINVDESENEYFGFDYNDSSDDEFINP